MEAKIPHPMLGVKIVTETGAITDYDQLSKVLDAAYEQAAMGKGKERHANALPFHEQPIIQIGKLAGAGFNVGQVIKKLTEAQGMQARGETEAALREVYGAIVYAASLAILWRE